MNNQEYWERRAAREMYEEMIPAEEAAKDIERLYTRTFQYIENKGRGIFEAFINQTGLTEEEARYYIKAIPAKDINSLILMAEQIQDKEQKAAYLQWIKAAATQHRLSLLFRLQQELELLFPLLFAAEKTICENTYRKIISDSFLHKLFEIQQQAGIGWRVGQLQIKEVEKILQKPWYGGNYSKKLWQNTEALAEAVKEELVISFLTGKTEFDSWKEIEKQFGKGWKAAHRLIRTESAYFTNQAQLESYERADIKKYIFVATLDLKTSEVCRSLDGRNYYVRDAKPGTNYPPMHPWCRSTTIAYLPPEILKNMKRIARDEKTGKNYKVPANMTYREWYEKYVIKGDDNENKSA